MAAQTPEGRICEAVTAEVRGRGGWLVKTTGVAVAGCPDFVGSYRGRALVWEVKTATGSVRPAQRVQLGLAARAGADARVVRSRSEARDALDAIDADLAMGHAAAMNCNQEVAR